VELKNKREGEVTSLFLFFVFPFFFKWIEFARFIRSGLKVHENDKKNRGGVKRGLILIARACKCGIFS
jgi:hypothetical protein